MAPGEQSPLADQDQNSFGRIRRAGTTKQKSRPWFACPEPDMGIFHLDSITMSDPFLFPDKKSKTYYVAGTWIDLTTLIEAVPRRHNVPRDQTRLLVSGNIKGPRRPLVDDYHFYPYLKI